MSLSYVQYVADGSTDEFDVPFPFASRTHVKVAINGAPPVLPIRWTGESRIKIADKIAAGALVDIRRETPISTKLVDFQNGSVLTEEELDKAIDQVLFLQQELKDQYDDTLKGRLAAIAEGGGYNIPDGADLVEELASHVIATEAAEQLRQAIADIELNGNNLADQAFDIGQLETSLQQAESARATAEANLQTSIDGVDSRVTTLRSDHDSLKQTVDALAGGDPGSGIATMIEDEKNQRIAGDDALAETISLIGAKSNDNLAFIFNMDTAKVSATESLAERFSALSATDANNTAAILAEETARITQDDALASSISLLDTRVGDAEAAILSEQTARANGDSANASSINALTVRMDTAEADIIAEQTARADGDSALTTSLNALTARVDTAEANIIAEQQARADGDSAEASARNVLSARVDKKNAVFRQPTAPTADAVGDIWIDSDDNNKLYRWDGTSWVETSDARIAANEAAIVSEQTARADGDTALSNSLNALTARVDTAEADIVTEQTARADGDAALTTQYNGLAARMTTAEGDIQSNLAAIQAEEQARADAISAEASARQTLAAKVDLKARTFYQNAAPTADGVGDIWFDTDDGNKPYRWDGTNWVAVDDARIASNEAAIVAEQQARADGDAAEASARTALAARVTTAENDIASNTSLITAEQTARADGDAALAADIALIGARSGDGSSFILDMNSVKVDASTALGTRLSGIDSQISDNAAAIVNEQTARADADSAIASDVTALTARVDTAEADIVSEQTARATADSAIASELALLGAQNAGKTAFVINTATAQIGGGETLATRFSALSAADANALSLIQSEETARINGDNALTSSLNTLGARVDDAEAAIVAEQTARASGDSANATAITNLTTTVNDNSASITTLQSSVNGLEARYGVALDVNGYVTGFLQNNDGTAGEFTILADKFRIVDPAGGAQQTPFVPFEIVNGQTFIKDAAIANLSVGKLATGVLTADVTQDGDWNVGTGKIIWDNGTHMKVAGVGFGSANQFIEWFGPKMAISSCTEANAISYLKTDGSAYFGGSLSAGVLKNSAQTTQVSATASVSTGNFGSNGGSRVVTVSYNSQRNVTISGACDGSGSPSCTLRLLRNGTELQSWTVNGSTFCEPGSGPSEPGSWSETMGGSFTYTDNSGGTSCEYTVEIVSRTLSSAPSSTTGQINHTQSLSVISIEE